MINLLAICWVAWKERCGRYYLIKKSLPQSKSKLIRKLHIAITTMNTQLPFHIQFFHIKKDGGGLNPLP